MYSNLFNSIINHKSGIIYIDNSRPWLKDIPVKFIFDFNNKKVTTCELSIAYYFKFTYPEIELNIMSPDVDYNDLDSNDITFVFNHNRSDSYLFNTIKLLQLFKNIRSSLYLST